MATLDVSAWIKYRQDGGRLSLSEWIAAGRPKGSPQPPSNPFTSNKPVPPSGNPLAPGLPHAAPKAIEDAVDADIAAAEAAAAEKEAEDRKAAEDKKAADAEPKTYHDDEGNTWYYIGFEKIDTGYDPQFDKRQKEDPELSDYRKPPSTPPPDGFHWEWGGAKWKHVKDEATATPERQKRSRQIGAPDKYFDAYGREWTWDDYEGYQETGYDKTKDTRLTEKDKGAAPPSGEVPTDRFGRKATWDADDGEWRYPPDWDTDPKGEEKGAAERAAKEAEDKRRFEIEQRRVTEEQTFRQQQAQQSSDQFWKQFDYQKSQDAARMQAEKEARLANLRQSPASWLQYSLEANQTPVIQPWQKPLMPQQYGNLNVGQPIPGWQGLNQGSANLPELTTPSTQYFARIGPTAQQQWGGYQQMQSGAPVDESMFRLQSQSAPGGRNQGLSWLR